MISSENRYPLPDHARLTCSVFWREWNSLRAKSASKFNKLICMPTIRCCDRALFREPLTRHPRFARCATFRSIPPEPAFQMSLSPEALATLSGVSTATITTVLLKKGLRNVWMRGTKPLRPGQPRLVGPAFTLRFVPAREDLATPESWSSPISTRTAIEAMPKGCIAVVDAMGVDRRRHLRRHSLRAHGQARRCGADHRWRGARRRRRARHQSARCGATASRRRLRWPG